MLIRRIALENVRSFLDRQEILLDGTISIVVGPNGGGKTNLLDTAVWVLRRHLFASLHAVHSPDPSFPQRHIFQYNDQLNNFILDRHSSAQAADQKIEIEIEITQKDIDGMRALKDDAPKIIELAKNKYMNILHPGVATWDVEKISPGLRVTYVLWNGNLQPAESQPAQFFLQFLQIFEMDGRLRDEYGLAPLTTPLIYLPVNRTAAGFSTAVQLAHYNESETKRQVDAASSRYATQIVSLAIGRVAKRYRLLLEKNNISANEEFKNDENLKQLTRLLKRLGYDWELKTINAMTNEYDIALTKHGSSFLVGAASSGERELLTYLFAIFGLNVRDALIIVDEPELHLHPKWQKTLLLLFIELANTTGNQFLLATHSANFISPESIHFVSRVYSQNQRSQIVRLNPQALPESKHLLNIVNSQNNERLFFSDKVILVEGISDRIFFEAILDKFGRSEPGNKTIEVINVGGKGLFKAYSKLLNACKIPFSIIADRDYIEQIGSPEVKSFFKINSTEIKQDVIDNIKSKDGAALVDAIEIAINSGSWAHARDIWDYIKSRRQVLLYDLNKTQSSTLDAFLKEKNAEGIHILRLGAIENYLPDGYAGKDMEKLIQFISDKEFWTALREGGKNELTDIANDLLLGIGGGENALGEALPPSASVLAGAEGG